MRASESRDMSKKPPAPRSKKKRAPAAPEFDFTLIPDNAFVIFRTEHPMLLAHALGEHAGFEERGITGTILDFDSELTALTDRDLASLGLQRIEGVKREGVH